MGGVGNHHIRPGQVLHHAPSGSLLHFLSDPALDLRISLGLLVLILDLLFGHAHVLAELEFLISKIRQCDDHIDRCNPNPQIRHQFRRQGKSLHQRHII